jgi:enoyl-CoA hydratase/carnithine racemase
MMDLRREDTVFVLTMQSGENRLNRSFVDAFSAALDEVERSSGPAALVTTGEDKFYSNGLDLAWMTGDGATEGAAFVSAVLKLLGRLLVFPVPTVAAINGHAFAAGAMLSLAHDFRIMRADRGFFCLPEVDINIALAPGMTALIRNRLSSRTFRDALLTGARFGGTEAEQRGIVDEAVAAGAVLPRAIACAAALASKGRSIYGALKRGMYADVYSVLDSGTLAAFS